MSRREEEAPISEDVDGTQSHPAFGVAGVTRRQGTPRALFQSDLMHSSTIVLSVQTAIRRRDLNRDWVHPREELIEIEMSETQWGSLVSSMGHGAGVPITIRRREADGYVPTLPYEPRTAESRREVDETVTKLFARAKESFELLEAAEARGAGVKERRELRRSLGLTLDSVGGNAKYAIDSMTEAAASLVSQAQADIEVHVSRAAAAYGIEAPVTFPQLQLDAAPAEPAEQ
jgi:hypothetical protein